MRRGRRRVAGRLGRDLGRFAFDGGVVDGLAAAVAEVLGMDDAAFNQLSVATREAFVRRHDDARRTVVELLRPMP